MANSQDLWPAWKRVPPFLPVPLRARADGWTADRQARFIGMLAETGCFTAAARAVGMTRESAYRLRSRDGAASFTHAWDAIIAFRQGGTVPHRKFTSAELSERALDGEYHILMRRRRFVRAVRKFSTSALLKNLRRLDGLVARAGLEMW